MKALCSVSKLEYDGRCSTLKHVEAVGRESARSTQRILLITLRSENPPFAATVKSEPREQRKKTEKRDANRSRKSPESWIERFKYDERRTQTVRDKRQQYRAIVGRHLSHTQRQKKRIEGFSFEGSSSEKPDHTALTAKETARKATLRIPHIDTRQFILEVSEGRHDFNWAGPRQLETNRTMRKKNSLESE